MTASTPVITAPRIIRNIAYVPAGHPRQVLDVYLPEQIRKPLPVILRIHGGAWWAYSKDDLHIAHRLIDQGYALVTLNYRYSRQAPFPAQIEDCRTAVRWIRAHAATYGFNPDKIGVCGDSAGGHLACLVGLGKEHSAFDQGPYLEQSGAVQAVMAWYPITDILQWEAYFRQCGYTAARAQDVMQCLLPLLGGPPAQRQDLARAASPLTYVHPSAPPFLLIHGTADDVVPFPQSQILADALSRLGVEARVLPVKGAGHGGEAFGQEEFFAPIVEFFHQHLGNPGC